MYTNVNGIQPNNVFVKNINHIQGHSDIQTINQNQQKKDKKKIKSNAKDGFTWFFFMNASFVLRLQTF